MNKTNNEELVFTTNQVPKSDDRWLEIMDKRDRPLIDKWTFSTNGVAIQGRFGIPCVGFGPGAESQAHAPNEITWKQDLVTCAALYASLPTVYVNNNPEAVKFEVKDA